MSEQVLIRDARGVVRPFPRITSIEGMTVVEIGDGAPIVLLEGQSLYRRMTSEYVEMVVDTPAKPTVPSKAAQE